MEGNSTILSSVQSLLESTDSDNPFGSPSKKIKAKVQSLQEEYTNLRVLNRKLWFGLWLYKFINKPAEVPSITLHNAKVPNKRFSLFSYLLISITVFLSVSLYFIVPFINKNKIA